MTLKDVTVKVLRTVLQEEYKIMQRTCLYARIIFFIYKGALKSVFKA